jgi:NADH-quinone oxidoreductase subunit M
MLYMYRRVIFGQLTKNDLKTILDLSPREVAVFAPLVFVTLWMGIYPAPFLDVMEPAVANLIAEHKTAMEAIANTTLAAR